MPAEIYWQSPDYVLFVQVTGQMSPDIMLKISEFVAKTLNSVRTMRVHVIIDALNVSGVSTETGALRSNLSPMLRHPSMGWCVVINSNPMIQAVLNRIVYRVTDRWGYVSTLADAVNLLRRSDPALPLIYSSQPETRPLIRLR